MKIIGVLMIVFALAIGFVCDKYPNSNQPEPIIGLAFCIFIFGMYCLTFEDNEPT